MSDGVLVGRTQVVLLDDLDMMGAQRMDTIDIQVISSENGSVEHVLKADEIGHGSNKTPKPWNQFNEEKHIIDEFDLGPTFTHATSGEDLVPKQRTWKRKNLNPGLMNTSIVMAFEQIGNKRKDKEIQTMGEAGNEKKQRLNEETMLLGKLIAESFGSVVTARQHRRES